MLVPVIIAGGSGTRLWPLSRKMYPKQFLSVLGGKSMLQVTLLRLDRLPAIVVCANFHASKVIFLHIELPADQKMISPASAFFATCATHLVHVPSSPPVN